jgi:hypothetical protein
MRPYSIRRLAAGLAAVALASLAAPLPATAAAPKAKVDILVKDYTLAPGSGDLLYSRLFATPRIPARNAAIHFELSGKVPGVTLNEAGHINNCSVDIATLLSLDCGALLDGIGPEGVDPYLVGYVEVGPTAVPGSVDTLTATLTVPGYAPVVRTSKIRVGDPVDLAADRQLPGASVPPGGAFDAKMTVRNDGPSPIRGTALLASGQWAYQSRAQFSNCWYFQGQVTACQFDQTLEPRTGYRVTLPYRLREDTFAPSDQYSDFRWLTSDEFADLRAFASRGGYGPLGMPGRGGALRLQAVATANAAPPQADPSYTGSYLVVSATGTRGADLAAVGDRASGKAGATVTVSVGVHNNGPATIDHLRVGGEIGTLDVTIPPGTTAVRVPDGCQAFGGDGRPEPGAPRYQCLLDYLLIAGRSSTIDFGLRVDRAVTGATGKVRLTGLKGDLKPSNNVANLMINPAGGSGSSGGSGSGGGSGGQGGGGGLPITGPAGAAAGGLGVLLVAAGVTGFLAGRRRRTRFES